MSAVKQGGALGTIFSFFLGLIVTAFIGIGVYTFHEPPENQLRRQLEDLNRQEQAVRDSRSPDQLSLADRDQIRELTDERNQLSDTMREARGNWARSTSIVLIALATLVMTISLVRADRLIVISNGLLLGGIFTMLYGVGWIVATDPSIMRFIVMTIALGITVGLGYLRFVRREPATVPVGKSHTDNTDHGELGQRVRNLEERMNQAASILRDNTER